MSWLCKWYQVWVWDGTSSNHITHTRETRSIKSVREPAKNWKLENSQKTAAVMKLSKMCHDNGIFLVATFIIYREGFPNKLEIRLYLQCRMEKKKDLITMMLSLDQLKVRFVTVMGNLGIIIIWGTAGNHRYFILMLDQYFTLMFILFFSYI